MIRNSDRWYEFTYYYNKLQYSSACKPTPKAKKRAWKAWFYCYGGEDVICQIYLWPMYNFSRAKSWKPFVNIIVHECSDYNNVTCMSREKISLGDLRLTCASYTPYTNVLFAKTFDPSPLRHVVHLCTSDRRRDDDSEDGTRERKYK